MTRQVIYHDYSDDGAQILNGTEESSGSIMSSTHYQADLRMTDAEGTEIGRMGACLDFTAAYSIPHLLTGNHTPELKKGSYGETVYQGMHLDLAQLVP